MFLNLQQHHVGCLVNNIEDFKNENISAWNEDIYSQIFTVSSQDVRVCFLQISPDTRIELVEPGSLNKPLGKLLNKGVNYYHIGFISFTYEQSVQTLITSNFRQLSEFRSEAFNDKRCAFFYHAGLGLLELIEG